MPRQWFVAKLVELGFERSPLGVIEGKSGRHEIYRRGAKDMVYRETESTASDDDLGIRIATRLWADHARLW